MTLPLVVLHSNLNWLWKKNSMNFSLWREDLASRCCLSVCPSVGPSICQLFQKHSICFLSWYTHRSLIWIRSISCWTIFWHFYQSWPQGNFLSGCNCLCQAVVDNLIFRVSFCIMKIKGIKVAVLIDGQDGVWEKSMKDSNIQGQNYMTSTFSFGFFWLLTDRLTNKKWRWDRAEPSSA